MKKVCKVWVFESKNPAFGSKSLEKVRKKFGKSSEKFGKVRKSLESSEISETGFAEYSEILEILEIVFFSEISENYEKMMLNLNFGNREKLVPTRKPTRKFG